MLRSGWGAAGCGGRGAVRRMRCPRRGCGQRGGSNLGEGLGSVGRGRRQDRRAAGSAQQPRASSAPAAWISGSGISSCCLIWLGSPAVSWSEGWRALPSRAVLCSPPPLCSAALSHSGIPLDVLKRGERLWEPKSLLHGSTGSASGPQVSSQSTAPSLCFHAAPNTPFRWMKHKLCPGRCCSSGNSTSFPWLQHSTDCARAGVSPGSHLLISRTHTFQAI